MIRVNTGGCEETNPSKTMDSKMCLTFLVVLSVVGSAFSDGCPSRRTIYPCTCQDSDEGLELFCHDEDMSLTDLKNVFRAFDPQHSLKVELYYINLGTVPTDFFQGFNIRVLDFAHCKFEQIPNEEGRILVGLENTLEELLVIDTIEKSNSPVLLDLGHLHKLTSLYLSDNAIPELGDNWFKNGPSSLTHLYIKDNGIEKIGSNAFSNLLKLKVLSLDGNQFGELKRSMLPNPATHLNSLYLANNALSSRNVPENFFTGMPALKSLSLADNILETLPEETFGKIWKQLRLIDLQDNALNCENSVLKWIFEIKHLPDIIGKCEKPSERKGHELWNVIQENQ